MSDPIKMGDLVAIVRSCCMETRMGRNIFTVTRFYDAPPDKCCYCKADFPTGIHAWVDTPGTKPAFPLSWLKRIPPLGELDDVKQDEEITA